VPGPDAAFWQQRFESGDTPWDRAAPSPMLLRWLDAGTLAPCRIAVPGCGSGWEVAELARRGFEVTAIDLVAAACARTKGRLASGGLKAEVVQANVLAWSMRSSSRPACAPCTHRTGGGTKHRWPHGPGREARFWR